ncbi:ABC transporter ATP-binding protein [Sedimentitalea sp. CY04]|uniref:ABC transporter ATP-binding protein n=1 Tax=Parasedimentitalea denitrificans TaxID=2211118 RepID=A0ABX0W6D5_9RHOB|nr:ABC transporter ATP-binding protein [Sedimentitalea sp. CY04]NIZ60207.1 ABC transporter ATP-binding protein [Sedimentitalea sp. CY04]
MTLLEVENIKSGYGPITALFGVSLSLSKGKTLALIGANGAGKTTLLRTLTGLNKVSDGSVTYEGQDISSLSSHQIASLGITMVPEGRRLFPSLTVEENILMGRCSGRNGPWELDKVYELFPILKERRNHLGTMLSGGQQQMVAVGRALMSNPQVLLCDELSLGLAPIIVQDIYKTLQVVSDAGVSLIIVEQDIQQAIANCDEFMCMRDGLIVLQGTKETANRAEIAHAYFGTDK